MDALSNKKKQSQKKPHSKLAVIKMYMMILYRSYYWYTNSASLLIHSIKL